MQSLVHPQYIGVEVGSLIDLVRVTIKVLFNFSIVLTVTLAWLLVENVIGHAYLSSQYKGQTQSALPLQAMTQSLRQPQVGKGATDVMVVGGNVFMILEVVVVGGKVFMTLVVEVVGGNVFMI